MRERKTIRCEAILFDMDGVLVDSLPYIVKHLREWAIGNDLDPDYVVDLSHGRTDFDVVRLAAPHLDPHIEARALQEQDVAAAHEVHASPGALGLVASLGEIPWAVVTSGVSPVARARLAAAGFPEPPVLVTSEDVTAGKPDPQCYLSAARLLGTSPERCLVIEDAPAGLTAAQAAGMMTVGVAGTVDPGELHAGTVVDDLTLLTIIPEVGILISCTCQR